MVLCQNSAAVLASSQGLSTAVADAILRDHLYGLELAKRPAEGSLGERSKAAADRIQAGLVDRKLDVIRSGVAAIEWGFGMQAENGSFPGGCGGMQDASLFIEAAARSILLMNALAPDSPLAERADGWMQRVHEGARWLARCVDVDSGTNLQQEPWTLAAALGESANATGDRLLRHEAEKCAFIGMKAQRPIDLSRLDAVFDAMAMAARFFWVCSSDEIRESIAYTLEATLEQAVAVASESLPTCLDFSSWAQSLTYGARILGRPSYSLFAARIGELRRDS
ncbi:MAG TPA: hypothetical protein VG944_00435 [Fimbriimonas sp.]|nr:hypothetical protein [Fimbriimonas sp.]